MRSILVRSGLLVTVAARAFAAPNVALLLNVMRI